MTVLGKPFKTREAAQAAGNRFIRDARKQSVSARFSTEKVKGGYVVETRTGRARLGNLVIGTIFSRRKR